MPTIIELNVDAITEESLARALLRLVTDLPGFEPLRYDLNQRGNFRGWDFDRAVVDLLTQRTQLFAIEGSGGQAFIATGKHGEPPSLALSIDVDESVLDELLAGIDVRAVNRG